MLNQGVAVLGCFFPSTSFVVESESLVLFCFSRIVSMFVVLSVSTLFFGISVSSSFLGNGTLSLLFLSSSFLLSDGEDGVTCVAFVLDRKSTRLNSSHVAISYAVFCLKKKTTPL